MNIGKIISVEYDKFHVKLFHTTKTSTVSLNGQIYYFGNIGSFLKTRNAVGDYIICEVASVLDQSTDSRMQSIYNLDSSRELILRPMGTLTPQNEFSMGIGIFPSIYSDVSIVTIQDIENILSPTRYKATGRSPEGIHRQFEIGTSKNMINYNINLNINTFFNIHTAVLGNTGSGKSNTIAHILQQVFRKINNHPIGAKAILFDVNGEYQKAFSRKISPGVEVKFYKPNIEKGGDPEHGFHLPYYLLNLDEWLAFLMASERTQKPFWDKVLQESFKFYRMFQENRSSNTYVNYFKWKIRNILVDVISKADTDTSKITIAQGIVVKCKEMVTNMNKDTHELIEFLDEINQNCTISYGKNDGALSLYIGNIKLDDEDAIKIDSKRLKTGEYFDYEFLKIAVDIVLLEEEAKGNSRIREYTSTMISRLDYFLENPDCNYMRNEEEPLNGEGDYLKKYFGIAKECKSNQLIIINSSEVGSDILELMTSVISRMIFDYRKRKEGDERREQPIHLILDEAHRYIKKDAEYILKENIFERIAREGRKFSLYLLVSSQRPSELSSTVLSQCGNYIIHRIQNDVDMKYIYSVLPYFSNDYTTKIKQAVPGEALIFGNCVPMPLQVKIHKADPDPNSENCNISHEWFFIEQPDDTAVN